MSMPDKNRYVSRPVTERQQQVLAFIAKNLAERGCPPTIREIGELIGSTSTNNASECLARLEQKRLIQRETHTARGIRITPAGHEVLAGAAQSPPEWVSVAPLLEDTPILVMLEVLRKFEVVDKEALRAVLLAGICSIAPLHLRSTLPSSKAEPT